MATRCAYQKNTTLTNTTINLHKIFFFDRFAEALYASVFYFTS